MWHEDIQRVYKDHYFISHRNMGGVRTLEGKVDVLVFFVNDSQSKWSEFAKKRYRAAQKAAMELVLHTAREKGVRLQLRNAYVEVTLPTNCTLNNYHIWSKAVIGKYGSADIPAYQRKHEAVKQCTEVPIIFVFNKPFRSSAVSVDWEARMQGEMSIISSQYNVHAIVHELLHQFGAVDLYYPEEVRKMIQKMGYESVMASTGTTHIDSLTAYLIGWTDRIDDAATLILEKTKHLTREYMHAAARAQYK